MKRVFNKLLLFLPYLYVFISSLYPPSDPDLGWHLKYGEYFFQHGSILRDNTFSVLMPNYHWANTSWLTDVITYAVFHVGSFFGLSLFGALVVTVTFFIFSKVARLTLWDQVLLFPLLLYLENPVNAVSFRGQQLSLLLLGVLFYLFSLYRDRPKILLLAIPLFALWANVNGEFLFGLGLFGIWIALYIGQKLVSSLRGTKQTPARSRPWWGLLLRQLTDRKDVKLIGIFFASIAASLLNPFGIGIHTAAISHFGSPLLKSIAEYLPFEMLSTLWWNQIAVGIFLVLGFIYLFFKEKVANQLPLFGTNLFVFVLSFNVRRFAWPAYYLVLPLLKPIATYFKPDSKKVTFRMSIILLFLLLGFAIYSKYPFTQLTNFSWNDYCQDQYIKCSPRAANYLQQKNLTKDLYSLYGWGGWLIWEYPKIKPTIDGRMHLWHENGYSAFEDYYAYEQNMKDIDKSKYNVAFLPPDKPAFDRLITLTNQGKWDLVYEDKYAGIFVREK